MKWTAFKEQGITLIDTGETEKAVRSRRTNKNSKSNFGRQAGAVRSHQTEMTSKEGKKPSQNEENRQFLRGSYTQILVNPTQLSDKEFPAWIERLVEARRNRQENKPRPYSQFRKPFLQRKGETEKTQQQQELKQ